MSLIPALPRSDARTLAAIGLDTAIAAIRRTDSGSIDFDHYLRRAQAFRGDSYRRTIGAIGRAIGGVLRAIRARSERRRALAELLSMDDRGLRDLGINRAGVYFAIDHGREDIPTPANINNAPAESPKVA